MSTRPAAIAGTFYPAAPHELRSQIRAFLQQAQAEHGAQPAPKAMIAPHAGTIYSGPVAASAYVRLRNARQAIERVVLLGPSHRVALRGVAAPSTERFATPLGEVTLDRAVIEQLLKLPGVLIDDEAHRREHSLEIHLPFLQEVLDTFTLVPLVVGVADAALVAAVIDACWGGPETLIVISSDLSHFHDYQTACAIDRTTTAMLEQFRYEQLNGERACGVYPLRGLLHTARARGMTLQTIDLRNSGDTAGPRREVVGYGSYVLD